MNAFYTSIQLKGSNILHRGYDVNGKRVHKVVKDFRPTVFQKADLPGLKTEWTSIRGEPMVATKLYDIASGRNMKYDESYHGMMKFGVQFAHEYYPGEVKYDPNKIKVGFYDIEVHDTTPDRKYRGFPFPEEANHSVVTIAIVDNQGSTHCLGLCDFKSPKGVTYHKFNTEKDLLIGFIHLLKTEDYDVLSGWNSNTFDMPYLYNRIKKICGESNAKKLSPFESGEFKTYEKFGSTVTEVLLDGIAQMDYLQLFKKFGYTFGTQESYKLDFIAKLVLDENKLDHSEYESLHEFYEKNPQKHTEYCIHDASLVKRLDDKLAYLGTAYAIAYMGHVNIPEALGTTSYWDSYIYGELLKEKVCVPPAIKGDAAQIAGGYVKEVIPGMYDWVVSGDINSLYPNIMLQYNISPETIRHEIPDVTPERLLDGDYPEIPEGMNLTAGGQLFDAHNIGIIPRLVEKALNERKVLKKELGIKEKALQEAILNLDSELISTLENEIILLNGKQMAVKISINSLYGATAASTFRYYDPRIAEAITLTGQLTIKTSAKAINEYLDNVLSVKKDRIVAMDTDSFYLCTKDVVDHLGLTDKPDTKIVKFLDKFYSDKLEPVVNGAQDKLTSDMKARKRFIVSGREGIASKSIFLGKKRYIQYVLDSGGVTFAEPKMKMMGIEAVKSSTPAIIRSLFKEAFKIIITEGEESIKKYIALNYEAFKGYSPEQIAMPRGVSDMEKYRFAADKGVLFGEMDGEYAKGCPKHVRAALVYNDMLSKFGVSDKYQRIYSGDKIKFVNLKKINPLHSTVVGFIEELPKEFGLDGYIDYEDMWNLTFLKPIEAVFEAVGWSMKEEEESTSLDSFF